MMARSFASWVVLLTLLVLAVLQIILQLAFWGGIANGDVSRAWLFQGIGAGLTLMEIFALVVASELASKGDTLRANWLRALFVVLAAVNLTADLSALSQFTGAEEGRRLEAARAYSDASEAAQEAEAEIVRLQGELGAMSMNRPTRALEAERAALALRADRYLQSGQAVPIRYVDQLAGYDSAIIIAGAIEAASHRRALAQAALSGQAAPESTTSPFAALARLAAFVGVQTDAEDIIAALAFAVALVVKLSLTVGFWCVTPRLSDLDDVRKAFRRVAVSADAPVETEPPPTDPHQADQSVQAGEKRVGRPCAQPKPMLGACGIIAMFDAARPPST